MLSVCLSDEQLQQWKNQHYLVLRSSLTERQVATLRDWTDGMQAWDEAPGQWMKYYEKHGSANARILCRMENFIDYHDGFMELFCGSGTMSVLEQLMGEPAVLFKEKINFKAAGSGGFVAHQMRPLGPSGTYHITMSVAVDSANLDNHASMSAPTSGRYSPRPKMEPSPRRLAVLPWTSVEMEAGDIIFFDSIFPSSDPMSRRVPDVHFCDLQSPRRRFGSSAVLCSQTQCLPPRV